MRLTVGQVFEALREVEIPFLDQDPVKAGLVQDLRVGDLEVYFRLAHPSPFLSFQEALEEECREALGDLLGGRKLAIESGLEVPPAGPREPLSGVKNVIAVASGKGGVGKSTVAVNLAVTLARAGARVGLLDADIHGPSVPLMMGLKGRPRVVNEVLEPLESHGVKIMSIGLLTGVEDAQIWRGPMVQSAVKQLLVDVAWGELDYLLVDLPPGTGDAQLTLTQEVLVSGAVVVSTPQVVALMDVRRGITMFRKIPVEILGVVENMSSFVCSDCGREHAIFDQAGAEREAERQAAPFLGAIPLVTAIRSGGDVGIPASVKDPEGPLGLAFRKIAEGLALEVARLGLARERCLGLEPAS
jgi:ATP-binding protein involved in chromosome partitioning